MVHEDNGTNWNLGDGHVVGGVNNYLKVQKNIRGSNDDTIAEAKDKEDELKATKNQMDASDQKA